MGRRIDKGRPVWGLWIRRGVGVDLKAPFGGGTENLCKTAGASIGSGSPCLRRYPQPLVSISCKVSLF